MTLYALIFTLAAIGISETSYLIKSKIKSEIPVCPINEDCGKVLESKYNKIFLIPNEFLGLLFYVFISLSAGVLVVGAVSGETAQWLGLIVKILIAGGSLFSLFLTYLQWRVIKSWCFWCLMSAFTVWLMFVIINTTLVFN
jgi:uncharacterized membrane protein